jgi:drug/metabolite transporter (DMT)-like permease
MIDPKSSRQATSSTWAILALGSFICWAFLSLMAKYFTSHGMPTLVFLTYIFAIATLCIVVEMWRRGIDFALISRRSSPFILIGIASSGFNFFNFYAISLAPNVGYVNATNAASIGAVTVVSTWLFKRIDQAQTDRRTRGHCRPPHALHLEVVNP